jgi:hypothetical protein
VRTQDIVSVLNNIAANSDGIQILWDFYRDNYQNLIVNFNNNQNIGITNSDRNRAIETINSNLNWMNAHKDEIGNFLLELFELFLQTFFPKVILKIKLLIK